jgi:hypothetical protein
MKTYRWWAVVDPRGASGADVWARQGRRDRRWAARRPLLASIALLLTAPVRSDPQPSKPCSLSCMHEGAPPTIRWARRKWRHQRHPLIFLCPELQLYPWWTDPVYLYLTITNTIIGGLLWTSTLILTGSTRNILMININVGIFLKNYGKKLVLIIIFTHIPN